MNCQVFGVEELMINTDWFIVLSKTVKLKLLPAKTIIRVIYP